MSCKLRERHFSLWSKQTLERNDDVREAVHRDNCHHPKVRQEEKARHPSEVDHILFNAREVRGVVVSFTLMP